MGHYNLGHMHEIHIISMDNTCIFSQLIGYNWDNGIFTICGCLVSEFSHTQFMLDEHGGTRLHICMVVTHMCGCACGCCVQLWVGVRICVHLIKCRLEQFIDPNGRKKWAVCVCVCKCLRLCACVNSSVHLHAIHEWYICMYMFVPSICIPSHFRYLIFVVMEHSSVPLGLCPCHYNSNYRIGSIIPNRFNEHFYCWLFNYSL